jgi:hypothetical protein
MCPIKSEQMAIDHIVDFAKDHTTFAAARDSSNNHLRIFLVYADTGNVYTRNGRADSWEELSGQLREDILGRIVVARNSVPVYKLNGSHAQ